MIKKFQKINKQKKKKKKNRREKEKEKEKKKKKKKRTVLTTSKREVPSGRSSRANDLCKFDNFLRSMPSNPSLSIK